MVTVFGVGGALRWAETCWKSRLSWWQNPIWHLQFQSSVLVKIDFEDSSDSFSSCKAKAVRYPFGGTIEVVSGRSAKGARPGDKLMAWK